ncbi:MAG: hypothetical protein KBF88_13280, partial [Polyangiaceae bacterium]|nr:hypothetical protein [Polyangiaceae bacterium]
DADEAAAGAMRVAIETGAFGSGYTLGADGVPNVAKDRQAGLDLVTRSSVCPASEGGKGLDLFLRKEAMTAGSRVVVFVPARPGPWMDRVVGAKKALQGRGTTFEWIVCCDGILEERPRSRLSRFLRAEEPVARAPHDAKTSSSELRSVIERLSTTRGSILYLDRLTGRIAPGSHCLPRAQS